MRKSRYLVVVLGQSENGFLLIKVPDDDVAVFAALTGREQLTVIAD